MRERGEVWFGIVAVPERGGLRLGLRAVFAAGVVCFLEEVREDEKRDQGGDLGLDWVAVSSFVFGWPCFCG